jgi:transaldolase
LFFLAAALKKQTSELGVAGHTCNPSIQEAEAGGSQV